MRTDTGHIFKLEDYRPSDYLIPVTGLDFRLSPDATRVTALLTLVAYLVPAIRERAFGVVERCLYVASLAWLLTTSIHLAVLAA